MRLEVINKKIVGIKADVTQVSSHLLVMGREWTPLSSTNFNVYRQNDHLNMYLQLCLIRVMKLELSDQSIWVVLLKELKLLFLTENQEMHLKTNIKQVLEG